MVKKDRHKASAPDPVDDVRVSLILPRSLTISWNAPHGKNRDPMANIITNYYVSWWRDDSDHCEKAMVQGTLTSFTINELQPMEEIHNVRVAACNYVGWGDESLREVHGQTCPDVPTIPYQLRISTATSTSVTPAWEPPKNVFGDDVRKYEAGIVRPDGEEETMVLPAEARQYTFGDLPKNSVSKCRVRAYNSAGWSNWTPFMEATTATGPPAKPCDVQVLNPAVDHVDVRWSSGPGYADAEEWELEVTQEGAEPEVLSVEPRELWVALWPVRSMWNITARVRARNDIGWGEWSEPSDASSRTGAAVWSWGSNERGQLGYPSRSSVKAPGNDVEGGANPGVVEHVDEDNVDGIAKCWTRVEPPRAVLTLNHTDIRSVSAGRAHSLALTDIGKVFMWGDNTLGQGGLVGLEEFNSTPTQAATRGDDSLLAGGAQLLRLPAAPVKWAGCCRDSVFAIVETSGEVYSWGSGSRGVLGHGDDLHRPAPCIVEYFRGTPVESVYCGFEHVLATTAGRVWAWGRGGEGQLGIGRVGLVTGHNICDWNYPQEVSALSGRRIVTAGLGAQHSCVILDGGSLLTFGCGRDGRLGHGNDDLCAQPKVVQALADYNIVAVACGEFHTAALDDNGRLWTWGNGAVGQLGLGMVELPDTTVSCRGARHGPLKVRLPTLVAAVADAKLEWVSCGPTSTFCGREQMAVGCGRSLHILQHEDGSDMVFTPSPVFQGIDVRVRDLAVGGDHVLICGGSGLAPAPPGHDGKLKWTRAATAPPPPPLGDHLFKKKETVKFDVYGRVIGSKEQLEDEEPSGRSKKIGFGDDDDNDGAASDSSEEWGSYPEKLLPKDAHGMPRALPEWAVAGYQPEHH